MSELIEPYTVFNHMDFPPDFPEHNSASGGLVSGGFYAFKKFQALTGVRF